MTIKITIPNSSSDVLTFGSGNTPTAAQIAGIDSGSSNGQLALYTTASGTSTEAMRINSSQNVGIGTSSPAFIYTDDTTFTVNGKQSATSYRSAIELGNNGSLGAFYFCSTANAVLGSYANIPLAFRTNNTERMRIESSGSLLVGKTTAGDTVAGFQVSSNGVPVSTCNANSYVFYNNVASAYRFFITAAGTINATNTTITGISDQRVKENIVDLDDGLDSVMALKPRKFDWKAGKGKNIKGDRGFIAQEFETVFPDMIEEWLDPVLEGEEPYKAVNANLIPTLVKAIQEQQAIITSLTARITALENK